MKNFLEIKNLNFSVDNEQILEDVTFDIQNMGDIICILGPSGIGKNYDIKINSRS